MSVDESNEAKWVETAVAGELVKLGNLPLGENIHRPGSTFFTVLLKLAAIVKGSGKAYLTPEQALQRVLAACQGQPWLKEKEIRRQWVNACKLANPRYRQPLPPHQGSR